MCALTHELRAFLESQPVGVLATLASDGKPRQSLVYFALEGNRLHISTLTDRVKSHDIRRSGWASLCVMGHERPFPSATFSGTAEILTRDIGGLTAKIVQRIAQTAEPPEPMTDEALAQAGRVVLAIHVDRVSAASYIPAAGDPSEGKR